MLKVNLSDFFSKMNCTLHNSNDMYLNEKE